MIHKFHEVKTTSTMNTQPLKLSVLDRQSVERGYVMREPYIVISIRDPDSRPVRHRRPSLCVAVLELAFHDAEPISGFRPSGHVDYMTNEDASGIWSFVRAHEGTYQSIVVHCEQGMSRSPAVAAALAEGLGLDSTRFWEEYAPNQFVYDKVLASRPA